MGYFVPKEYLFTQDSPSALWVIKHACGYPMIDVYITVNGKNEKIIPQEIVYVSQSQVEVHFTRPFAGFAKIVG